MAKPCHGAPAIPREEIYEGLSHNSLDPRTARELLRDPDFLRLQYRAHQIFYVLTWARDTKNIPVSIGGLARSFNCSPATIKKALKNGWDDPKPRGRHRAISAEAETDILNWIRKSWEKSSPVTRTDIRHYCEAQFATPVTCGWVDSFISRNATEIIEAQSQPQEEPRLQVPRTFLEETLRAMGDAVHGCPADLVFNLDEVGISEWEDRKVKNVVVPLTVGSQTVHHRVSRNLKHLSIITCISAGGACLTPYVVSSQASQPIKQALADQGLQLGRHLILRQRDKAYVNGEIFKDYIQRVFIPHLEILRQKEEFAGEEAALLMDNCPSHVKPEILGILTEARVRIVTFAPHTTNLFQALDLTLFGAFKKRGQYQLPFDTDQRTANFIMKVYRDFRATMIDVSVLGAFRAIGLTFHADGEITRVHFDEIRLRQSPGFRELWAIDYPPENLSARRRGARFGWINRME
jgi:hypothetical protein